MHIVLAILGILGAIAAWRWRVNEAARGAEEVMDLAKTAANLPRRLRFARKAGKNGLSLVEDPRDAATIMLIEMARADGDMTQEHRHLIQHLLQAELGFATEEAEETIVNAAWILRDVPPPDVVIGKMTNLLVKNGSVGDKELMQLDQMLTQVGEVGGPLSARQAELVSAYRSTWQQR